VALGALQSQPEEPGQNQSQDLEVGVGSSELGFACFCNISQKIRMRPDRAAAEVSTELSVAEALGLAFRQRPRPRRHS